MKIPTFERRNEIIRMLQEHGYVKAQMLAKQYQVSMETIRKDLTFLEAAGIAHRSMAEHHYPGRILSRRCLYEWGMAPEKGNRPLCTWLSGGCQSCFSGCRYDGA